MYLIKRPTTNGIIIQSRKRWKRMVKQQQQERQQQQAIGNSSNIKHRNTMQWHERQIYNTMKKTFFFTGGDLSMINSLFNPFYNRKIIP